MDELINEAAKDYKFDLVEGSDRERQAAYDGFVDGAHWAFELPLEDRLTDSEKEKLRREYRKSYSASFEPTNCLDRQYARGRYQVLREIFGAGFFKEDEYGNRY